MFIFYKFYKNIRISSSCATCFSFKKMATPTSNRSQKLLARFLEVHGWSIHVSTLWWLTLLWKITMFNGKSPCSITVFHSYVRHYQRVNPIKSHQTTIFPWFSYGFPVNSCPQLQNRPVRMAFSCQVMPNTRSWKLPTPIGTLPPLCPCRTCTKTEPKSWNFPVSGLLSMNLLKWMQEFISSIHYHRFWHKMM